MKQLTLNRFVKIAARATEADSEDGDHLVDMAFASEQPYERWFGIEVLDCKPESVRLDRLNDGAPVLFNHDWKELRGVHVPGSAVAKNGKVRGTVRLTAATQAGRDTIALVKSGVLTKASVGYIVHKIVEVTTKKDGGELHVEHDCRQFRSVMRRFADTGTHDRAAFLRALDEAHGKPIERAADKTPVFRVMDWEPYENSLVTVPADPTVGIGRVVGEAAGDALPLYSRPTRRTVPAGYLPPWMVKKSGPRLFSP
jgi:hypothetical protein